MHNQFKIFIEYPRLPFRLPNEVWCVVYLWLTLPMSSLASCEPAHAAKCRHATREVLKLVGPGRLSDYHWPPLPRVSIFNSAESTFPVHMYAYGLFCLRAHVFCPVCLTIRMCEFVGQQSVTTDLYVFSWVSFRTLIIHNQTPQPVVVELSWLTSGPSLHSSHNLEA